ARCVPTIVALCPRQRVRSVPPRRRKSVYDFAPQQGSPRATILPWLCRATFAGPLLRSSAAAPPANVRSAPPPGRIRNTAGLPPQPPATGLPLPSTERLSTEIGIRLSPPLPKLVSTVPPGRSLRTLPTVETASVSTSKTR